VDSSADSHTEVAVDPLLVSRQKPTGVHAEVETRVDQELPFTKSVLNEDAACRLRAERYRL
jgi:hypothetical protein